MAKRYQREVIRIRISKKNQQHNGQKKKVQNNDLQTITQKTKDGVGCGVGWMNIRCQVRSPCLSLEQELLILPELMSSPSALCGVRVARSLVFCVIICRSLFALMFFFIWQLCCLSFLDLRLLIDPLVSLCFLFIPRPLCVLIFVQPLNHLVFFYLLCCLIYF